MKKNGVKYGLNSAQISRRKSVIVRLTEQLKRGTKTNKEGKQIELSDFDRKRILAEIKTLESRLVSNYSAKLKSRTSRY